MKRKLTWRGLSGRYYYVVQRSQPYAAEIEVGNLICTGYGMSYPQARRRLVNALERIMRIMLKAAKQ